MTTGQALPAPPPRGTRPRNRRALILAAATTLFYQRGYAQVAMSDIAEAVAIRPSALYRHFPGKQQLLAEAVLDSVGRIETTLRDEGADAVPSLAAAALDQRETGLLWQREGRHLPSNLRDQARARLRAVRERLADVIRVRRPDLDRAAAEFLAHCVLSALSSPSFHHLELPRNDHERLIAAIVTAVIDTPLPNGAEHATTADSTEAGITVRSRRETILNTAIVMFAEQGYSTVGLEDIARRVGVTGPNIYHYFPGKADILFAAFQRGNEWLRRDLNEALSHAHDHPDALDRLARSYATFTLSNSHLIDLLITEVGSLPPEQQTWARHTQHDYIAEWVHLLHAVRRGLGPTAARIPVQAWFTIVNDTARNPRLRHDPGVLDKLTAIASAVLTAR